MSSSRTVVERVINVSRGRRSRLIARIRDRQDQDVGLICIPQRRSPAIKKPLTKQYHGTIRKEEGRSDSRCRLWLRHRARSDSRGHTRSNARAVCSGAGTTIRKGRRGAATGGHQHAISEQRIAAATINYLQHYERPNPCPWPHDDATMPPLPPRVANASDDRTRVANLGRLGRLVLCLLAHLLGAIGGGQLQGYLSLLRVVWCRSGKGVGLSGLLRHQPRIEDGFCRTLPLQDVLCDNCII